MTPLFTYCTHCMVRYIVPWCVIAHYVHHTTNGTFCPVHLLMALGHLDEWKQELCWGWDGKERKGMSFFLLLVIGSRINHDNLQAYVTSNKTSLLVRNGLIFYS